jgi:hypothetical protein
LVEELNIKKAEVAPKSKFSFKPRKPNVISESGKITETENKKECNITTTATTVMTTSDSTSSIINENFQVIALNSRQYSYLSSSTNDSMKTIDFHLSDLQNCFINLVNKSVTIGAIHIKGLKNCVILAGPVNSSILTYDCENCVFVVACHQVKYG